MPLQPLADNLDHSVYETFERDRPKYEFYQEAIRQAVHDLQFKQEVKNEATGAPLVIAVLGAGRGPLVESALLAADDVGAAVMVMAIEKNPNAVAVLQGRLQEARWAGRVALVAVDMRDMLVERQADIMVRLSTVAHGAGNTAPTVVAPTRHLPRPDPYITCSPRHACCSSSCPCAPACCYSIIHDTSLDTAQTTIDSPCGAHVRLPVGLGTTAVALQVSELLGSFGDNELCPECLDGADGLLRPGGISIPAAYTSFLAPVSAHTVYSSIRHMPSADRLEVPMVVRLWKHVVLSNPQPVFGFTHPRGCVSTPHIHSGALVLCGGRELSCTPPNLQPHTGLARATAFQAVLRSRTVNVHTHITKDVPASPQHICTRCTCCATSRPPSASAGTPPRTTRGNARSSSRSTPTSSHQRCTVSRATSRPSSTRASASAPCPRRTPPACTAGSPSSSPSCSRSVSRRAHLLCSPCGASRPPPRSAPPPPWPLRPPVLVNQYTLRHPVIGGSQWNRRWLPDPGWLRRPPAGSNAVGGRYRTTASHAPTARSSPDGLVCLTVSRCHDITRGYGVIVARGMKWGPRG